MPEPSASSAAEFQQRLADLGIEAVLIGALAAGRYRSTPRFTTDIDFLARSLDGLVDAMRNEGHSVTVMAEPGKEPYLVFIRDADLSVDVILAETDYQTQALDRAVGGVLSVEDVIVHKLIAWRPKDIDDVASILSAGHQIDDGYVRQWAGVWDVLDRWDRTLEDQS